METGNVTIKELNAENWFECCELKVGRKQEAFMEPNAISIAQSKFEPSLRTYAIYENDKIVGFLMYNTELEELDGYWIYRIMVDEKFQGKGIGKAATKLMISEMSKLPNANKIIVGYHPENKGAHLLYASIGFMDYGDRFGKEMAVIKYVNQ